MNWLGLNTLTVLLAQGGYTDMGRRFRHGNDGVDPTTFALFVGSLVAILVIALIATRVAAQRQAPGYESVPGLFRELCKAHSLDWASSRLLKKLAAHHGLQNPSQLFLDPSYFEAERIDGPLADFRDRLKTIGNQIFATE